MAGNDMLRCNADGEEDNNEEGDLEGSQDWVLTDLA